MCDQNPTVTLSQDCAVKMSREARRRFPLETGGILLGHHCAAGVVVVDVIGPGPDALHLPTSFLPDQAWQERRVAHLYRASGRQLEYLGDWHTHPNGCTTPSGLDARAAERIALFPPARSDRPILLIVSLGPDGPTRCAGFMYYAGRLKECAVVLATTDGWMVRPTS